MARRLEPHGRIAKHHVRFAAPGWGNPGLALRVDPPRVGRDGFSVLDTFSNY